MVERTPPAPAERVLIIAEVAQAHDGSLGAAQAYVDAAAKAGADVVKFQTHIAAAESTPHEPWRVRFSPRDETRYEYWKRMEFTEEEWLGLRKHALKAGVDFLSSPFSVEALELLERVGVMGWKVASGEVGNLPMLNRMAATREDLGHLPRPRPLRPFGPYLLRGDPLALTRPHHDGRRRCHGGARGRPRAPGALGSERASGHERASDDALLLGAAHPHARGYGAVRR